MDVEYRYITSGRAICPCFLLVRRCSAEQTLGVPRKSMVVCLGGIMMHGFLVDLFSLASRGSGKQGTARRAPTGAGMHMILQLRTSSP